MPEEKKRPSSPFDAALKAIKEREVNEARKRLGIPHDAVTDDDLVQAMICVDQGIELSLVGRQIEAVEYLQKALPVVGKCSDIQAKAYFDLLTRIAVGTKSFHDGNTVAASEIFKGCADMVERAAFFFPTLKTLTLQNRAWCEIAQGRTMLSIGNMKDAESHLGKANDFLTQALDSTSPTDPRKYHTLIGVYETRIETAISFAFIDLQALDLESTEKRLNAVSEDAVNLQKLLEKVETGPIRNIVSASTKVFAAMKEIHYLATRILHNRSRVDKKSLNRFKQAAQLLFDAEESAKMSGGRGGGFLFTIGQMKRILQHLLQFGEIRKGDFGRYGGIISLFAFIVVIVVIWLTVNPSVAEWTRYFIGAIALSLIVGFGYGALEFVPLLRTFTDTQKLVGKKEEENQETSSSLEK